MSHLIEEAAEVLRDWVACLGCTVYFFSKFQLQTLLIGSVSAGESWVHLWQEVS
jgi:hypothetical protein